MLFEVILIIQDKNSFKFLCLRQDSPQLFLPASESQFFVDNIGNELVLRTDLSDKIPSEFANGTKEFSFSKSSARQFYHRFGTEILQAVWCFWLTQFLAEYLSLLGYFQSELLQLVYCTLFVLNIWPFVILDGADKGLSFSASFCPCRKVSKHIIAPTDSDLNNRAPLCLF